ncbi:MAG: hypothetical protein Q9165_007418 [Trypethelium subeluteriae]
MSTSNLDLSSSTMVVDMESTSIPARVSTATIESNDFKSPLQNSMTVAPEQGPTDNGDPNTKEPRAKKQHVGRDHHESNAIEAPQQSLPKRVGTAPSWRDKAGLESNGRRPWRLRSKTSWLTSKSKSDAEPGRTNLDPFPYHFEPFSDSNFSSSSSDEFDGQNSDDTKTQRDGPKLQKVAHRSKDHGKSVSTDSSSEEYDRFKVGNEHFRTKGKVSKRDGRLKITVNETLNSGYLARALGAGLRHHLDLPTRHKQADDQQTVLAESLAKGPSAQDQPGNGAISSLVSNTINGPFATEEDLSSPGLDVVIIVIGSRGDIQPFLKIGKTLKKHHGHRVRVATHPAFKKFVEEDSGLEFFSVGGDPSELMAFMVKNPGLIPSLDTVKQGEIGRRRKAMYEMFNGMWRACTNATDEIDHDNHKKMDEKRTFVADAIIANPPSFAHVHIAERLGIPLHIMFTFPYSPTTAFPHPLANIKKGNVDANYTNFMSYPLVELMTWQGLGDMVNKFRTDTLGLDPVSTIWAPGQLYRFKVPHTYLWSPSLVPKPTDWGPEIEIGGFVFLDMAESFEPPQDLTDFLNAGDPPVYIGFGSIVVDDPESFTNMIFKAVKQAGVRALVSKGWGGIGGEGDDVPDNIFMLGNTPHDWLFPKCAAVVHHGGAGTTAIGLKCGKPTMIVPFFGDQPFWGNMVARAGAGAKKCIPYKKLTADKLARGIGESLTEEARHNVKRMADGIAHEGDGADNAVKSFQRHLPVGREGQNTDVRCELLKDRVAVWRVKDKKHGIRVSALAAEILVERKKLNWNKLRLVRHFEWNDFGGPGEPITGIGAAVSGTVTGLAGGVSHLPVGVAKTVKARGKHEKKKRTLEKKRKQNDKEREQHRLMEHEETVDAKADVAGRRDGVTAIDQQQNRDPEKLSPAEDPLQSHGTIPDLNTDQAIRSNLNRSDSHQQEAPPPPQHASSPSTPNQPATQKPFHRHPTTALNRASTLGSTLSADPLEALPTEIAGLTGDSALRIASTLAAHPVDLALAVAQGFHNAPRLYGDETVRQPPRITGWRSGMRAARLEFAHGIRDGWGGLVGQPRRGVERGFSGEAAGVGDRALGGLEGFGKGVGGWVLKDVSAMVGPLAFVAQGLRKEVGRGRQPTGRLREARVRQGRWEVEREVERREGGGEGEEQGTGRERLEREVLNAWMLKGDVAMDGKKGKKGRGKSKEEKA